MNTVASRISKNKDLLAEYGVAINDENNKLKSTRQILDELYPVWQKMSNAQKVSLGIELAGY